MSKLFDFDVADETEVAGAVAMIVAPLCLLGLLVVFNPLARGNESRKVDECCECVIVDEAQTPTEP